MGAGSEPQPVEVVEHQIEQGWCANCRKWHWPILPWPKIVGQGRIGVRLMGLVGYMLDKEVVAIQQEARASPFVHMDETGWRENGQNGYIWCLVADNPRPTRYFEYHQSRAGQVAKEMLGDEFAGILVSDFYGAYSIYPGRHQRGWVHLLRDLAELREAHAEDAETVAWCVGVKNLYYLAVELTAQAQSDMERRQHVA